jgi:hypothetical protein
MAIRYRPSDFTKGGQGGCPACSGVQADVISGDLRVESTAGGLPGKTVWPLLGCLYRSTDTGDGPFGVGRSAAGVLGVKVISESGGASNANVVDELGGLTYYVYTGEGGYTNQAGGLNELYTQSGEWRLDKTIGQSCKFDSSGKLNDSSGNSVYFYYDGSSHYQKALSKETGRALYFETDTGGRITSVKDWGGRETAVS